MAAFAVVTDAPPQPRLPERVLFALAAAALLVMTPVSIGIGALVILLGFAVHLLRRKREGANAPTAVSR